NILNELNLSFYIYENDNDLIGLSYKGTHFVFVSDSSPLNMYFNYQEKNYNALKRIINQEITVDEIINEIEILTSLLYKVQEKANKYKRFYQNLRWLKIEGFRTNILLTKHYFNAKKVN
ncbi:hypothetical protein, partial [Halobacillus sp. BAB-2008]|uniref:hypothetical protein n=1 Tax=Halobacillus sp. BAB-2008 TaxID=1246484 RepID=UPI0002A4D1A2